MKDNSQRRKMITTIALGICGGIIFIICNTENILGALIVGVLLGFAFLGWIFYSLGSGVSRAKRFAEQAIRNEEIKDIAKADRVIAVLNLLTDTDSKYLLIKLKDLKEKPKIKV